MIFTASAHVESPQPRRWSIKCHAHSHSGEGALHRIATGIKVHVDRALIVKLARYAIVDHVLSRVACVENHAAGLLCTAAAGGSPSLCARVALFIYTCVEAAIPLGTHCAARKICANNIHWCCKQPALCALIVRCACHKRIHYCRLKGNSLCLVNFYIFFLNRARL
jgi:hypothetical protein